MPYNYNAIVHTRAVKALLPRYSARAHLDINTFKLELRGRGKRIELHPQFVMRRNGARAYTPRMAIDAPGFLGWRPYFNKVWPAAVDKASFKEYCGHHELPTPKQFKSGDVVDVDVLVKRSRSSFGQGIVGPLRPEDFKRLNLTMADGEFVEAFIEGGIGKFWFWNDTLAVIEIWPMIDVQGDSHSTALQLIEAKRSTFALLLPDERDCWAAALRFQGIELATVIPKGKTAIVDFRYQSSLHPPSMKNSNLLAEYRGTPVVEQLTAAGKVFWNAIPESVRENVVYTIDAIVDPRQKIWFLEMNCNPLMHPDVYPL